MQDDDFIMKYDNFISNNDKESNDVFDIEDIVSQLSYWDSSHVNLTVGGVKIEMKDINKKLLESIIKEMNDFQLDHDKGHGQGCYDRGSHDKACFDRSHG
jgi:hypothetical protein